MVFSSIFFLLYFLPVFFVVYQLLWRNDLRNLWILAASIFFYSWGAPTFVFILVGSTVVDFYLVRSMYRSNETLRKKCLLVASLILNLGLLAYFKYSNFFVENCNQFLEALGMGTFSWAAVVLPIGISFYTFQTLTYSIDIYRGISRPLERVTDYLLYIMMFPQLIAGPIVRYHLIADEIRNRPDSYNDKLHGFFRFSIGLSKKVIIANSIGLAIDPLFLQVDALNTGTAWIAILGYTFQIYFDFSGYSDMAIGLGKMMGFNFPENFNSPYISKSITEFWRRWHITLGEWMRDYLYIPLGGNRVNSTSRLYFNLSFVFLMSGLWHGASWNFVLWGVFHGAFLVLDRLFLLSFLEKRGRGLAILFTFLIVVLSWVVFRLEHLNEAITFYHKMFNFSGSELPIFSGSFWLIFLLAIFISICTLIPNAKSIEGWLLKTPSKLSTIVLQFSLSCILFLICLSELSVTGFNPFIYFRF